MHYALDCILCYKLYVLYTTYTKYSTYNMPSFMVKYRSAQSMAYFFRGKSKKGQISRENLVLFRSIALLVVPVIFFILFMFARRTTLLSFSRLARLLFPHSFLALNMNSSSSNKKFNVSSLFIKRQERGDEAVVNIIMQCHVSSSSFVISSCST